MLSEEEKARIEQEERKRIAEEAYRSEVRAKFQQASLPPSPAPKKNIAGKVIGVALMLVVAVTIAGYVASRIDSSPTTFNHPPKTGRWVTQKDSIASGQITVRHGGFVSYKVTITPEMSEATVTGRFSASGGAGNDIAGVLADEENYTNWINGHQSRAYWSTPGKETAGDFSVTLAPGTYYLAFSNRFSTFTDKDVFIDASVTYQKPQTE